MKRFPDPTGQPWWKSAVIYQVYPLSFSDSNGDGIGDIPGILSRLDYLADLGIDAIWLSPVYCSPMADNGYDISDYRAIDPVFGTMKDMEDLIREAGKRNIRILMDLVLNHSSDEHIWFREAKKSRLNPYHDYYIWRDEGDQAITEEKVDFADSSWEWVPEVRQYYYHQFSAKQPDLNWENPALRAELYDMIRWWKGKGIGGFRLDVVDHLGKDPDRHIRVNGPRLHEFVREMSRECFQDGDLLTVGEAWSATTEIAKRYSAPDGSELSMIVQFEHIKLDQKEGREKWDLAPLPFLKLKQVLAAWQKDLFNCGWNSQFWENHDLPRIVSRWGDDGKYRAESAKMLAVLLLSLQGTPFIYQGQEIGMTNAGLALEEHIDIETRQVIRRRREIGFSEEEILRSVRAKSRDNARTPMQWNAGKNAGFTAGKPWMPVNPNYREVNVENQIRDETSVYSCYKNLIRIRKQHPVFVDGEFHLLLEAHEEIFAFTRSNHEETLLILANFYGRTIPNPLQDYFQKGEILFSTYPDIPHSNCLRPYEAAICKIEPIPS